MLFFSDFLKNVLALLTGSTIAQLIPLLASFLIARLYSPQDFGIFAFYLSIFNLISIIATGRYDIAIVLPKDDQKAVNLLVLALVVASAVSIISIPILFFLSKYVLTGTEPNKLSPWLFLIPAAVFVSGAYRAFSFWLNRKKQYGLMAAAKVTRSLTISGINIGFGYLQFFRAGLIAGQFLGDMAALAASAYRFVRYDRAMLRHLSKKSLIMVAKKYKDFPFFNALQAFTDQAKESGILLIIASFYHDTILGLYAFGLRYTLAPIGLLQYSISQILYKKLSDLRSADKPLYGSFKQVLSWLAAGAVLLFCLLFFLTEPAFALAFGEEWRTAGVYVSILSPYIAVHFVSSTISTLSLILEKQKQFFKIALLTNGGGFVSVLLSAFYFGDIIASLWTISIVFTGKLLFILFWFMYLVKDNDRNLRMKACIHGMQEN